MTEITGTGLRLEPLAAVARGPGEVRLDRLAVGDRMEASRAWVERAAGGEAAVYGINTGFGVLARQRVAPTDASRLSRNVILKCCAGVGDPLSRRETPRRCSLSSRVKGRPSSSARRFHAR